MNVMTTTWVALCPETEFPEDGKLAKEIGGWNILVLKADDGLYAVIDRCTHQAALLSLGRVRRGAIMCPLHGARFEIATGHCIGGTYADLHRFDLRVIDGQIEVEVPDRPPDLNERPVSC